MERRKASIGWTEVREAWRLFRSRIGPWLGLGLVAGTVEAALLLLYLSAIPRLGERRNELPLFAVGAVATAVGFLIAGGLVRVGLRLIRASEFRPGLMFISRRALGSLCVAALGSVASYRALSWLLSSIWPKIWIAYYAIDVLAAVPFVLTIPLIADRGLGPVDAVRESLRRALPHYFGILIAQISVYVLSLLATFPVSCLMQIAIPRAPFNPWLFGVVILATFAFALPFYYLAVCCIYRQLIPYAEGEGRYFARAGAQ